MSESTLKLISYNGGRHCVFLVKKWPRWACSVANLLTKLCHCRDYIFLNAITIPTHSKIPRSLMFEKNIFEENQKHNSRSITTTTALKTCAILYGSSVSGFALTFLKVSPDYLSALWAAPYPTIKEAVRRNQRRACLPCLTIQ